MTKFSRPPAGENRPTTPFRAELSYPRAEVALCTVTGELDLATAPQWAQQLQTATVQPRHLVIDLDAVTFFCATAVRVLIDARDTQAHHERTLILACPQPCVTRVLEVLELTHLFPSYHDLPSAITACDAAP